MKYAIIVAGGNGSRVGGEKPKQFLLVAGKPVLMHTLEKFYSADNQIKIILVLPQSQMTEWKTLCEQFHFQVSHEIAVGGDTRYHSVKNGLNHVDHKGIVAVHDGVRPLVSIDLINRCYHEAEIHGNAVPYIALADSIRRIISKDVNEVADRSSIVIIQTPQCFDSEILKKAYAAEFKDIFTDDATVVEFSGHDIHLTDGERRNIKITFPADFDVAESLLKSDE